MDKRINEDILQWKGRSYLYGIVSVLFIQPVKKDWLKNLFVKDFFNIVDALDLSSDLRKKSIKMKYFFSNCSEEELGKWTQDAEFEYNRLFVVPVKGEMVLLGASAYLPKNTNVTRRCIAWEELYQRFAFNWQSYLSDTLGVWPNEPEHLVLLLPFLSIMSDEVARSLEDDDEFKVSIKNLFNDIINSTSDWTIKCLKKIENNSKHSLYSFITKFTREIIENDVIREL